MNRKIPSIALALLLVISGAGLTSAVTVYDIDTDHELASSSAVDEYESDGIVSTSVLVPDLRITIAADHEDAGVEGFRADVPWHYVRLQYNETLTAEIRLYFPSEYWHPHPQDLSAIDSNVDAELRPVEGKDMSSLSVRFDGKSDVTFAVPRTASLTFATRDYGKDIVENRTNLTLPRAGSSEPWSYIDQAALSGNTTVSIQPKENRELSIQYDAGDIEERWIGVPSCSSSTGQDEPVCMFTRDGEDRIYILSRVSDPPPVRYKYDPGALSQIKNLGNSLKLTIERASSWISDLFGTVIVA